MDFKRTITDTLTAKKVYVEDGRIMANGEEISIDNEVISNFEGRQIVISIKSVSEDGE